MPEIEDKQALINVLKRDTGIPFDQTVDIAVLQLVTIATLNLRRTDASRIAFFAPEESFVGNFGEIPQLLEAMGNEVIWLFGQPDRFLDTSPKNGYFIMDDMIRPLKNIDVIVTATVMDCLPPTSKAVLIDHISFAPVEVESLIKSLDKGEIALPHEYQTKEEFFETFTAFIGYLPYYSLILTPSNSVSDISNRSLGLLGYEKTKTNKSQNGPASSITDNTSRSSVVDSSYDGSHRDTLDEHQQKKLLLTAKPNVNFSAALPFLSIENFKEKIVVAQSGYPKLDIPYKLHANSKPQGIIVYAPTPNDLTGNKQSEAWQKAITINDYGVDVMRALLSEFPDMTVVFKPYKRELPDLVRKIDIACKEQPNYRLDTSGSAYWDLYSKTNILVSDFSSTAYTFATGLQRPVAFFSPNEDELPSEIINGSYCQHRKTIGSVSKNCEELISDIKFLLSDYDHRCSIIEQFVVENFFTPGEASRAGAECINNLAKNVLPIAETDFTVWQV